MMNEQNISNCALIRRFFDRFGGIRHHGVQICKFIYIDLLSNWKQKINKNDPLWQEDIIRSHNLQIYQWADEPYIFKPHPDGVVLMRGGFGDLASSYLPKERCFLISPNQAEVNLIKLNRPDLTSHNIGDYFRDNPQAIEDLNLQITQVVKRQKNDPLFGSADFLNWFKNKIPQIVGQLDAVQLLFDTFHVAAVLTVSSVFSMDGALNLIARVNQVPSFTLQHGLMSENDLFYHVPILATKKIVWGNAIQKWYQKFGYPESRVSVIGSPRFDIIFNRDWCGKEKLCTMLGIDPSIKVVVYGADIIRIDELIVPVLLEGLRSVPGIYLVMLQHPGENPKEHEKLAAGYPNGKVVQFGHISLYDALSGADLFITSFSTSALEAMFFKLPVVTIEPTPPTFSFGDLGASLKVTNAAELNQTVKQLLSDPGFKSQAVERYQGFLHQYCIPDGLASKRLFEEVESLCRNGGIA